MTQAFARQLNNAKNLMAGLTTHAAQLGKRGITPEVIAQMTSLYEQANRLDDERNAIKARSQEATVQVEQVMTELERLYAQAKKLVRIELPSESWPEFGFRKGEYAAKAAPEPAEQETTVV